MSIPLQSNENKEWISSTCNYGDEFIASVRKGKVHAVQFHPEKSGGKLFITSTFFVFNIWIVNMIKFQLHFVNNHDVCILLSLFVQEGGCFFPTRLYHWIWILSALMILNLLYIQ